MESIIDFLRRKLRDAGPPLWPAIADVAGVAKSLPRKIAYSDRSNPGVQTVQPLIDYFSAVDRGERELPAAKCGVREARTEGRVPKRTCLLRASSEASRERTAPAVCAGYGALDLGDTGQGVGLEPTSGQFKAKMGV